MGDTQPRTFKLSPSALLSFPRRLCNPPPSVGKVRSFSVTAVVDVKLDDVLDRKHLPPLGLKDFEEWLLFVEQNAENLYFILWLKEYNARYTQWMNTTRASHPYQSSSLLPPSSHPNRALALFYSRAKQTFFTPNSPYELDLPSDILGPFHTPSLSSVSLNNFSASTGALSPHPDPAVFAEVEEKVRSMLQESLDRFAMSTVTNVGTARATCGTIGGTVIALAGFLPPIAENFALSRNRWLRLLAFPGLWLGLTIVLASLHGVCMMIYIFGDLRQLRSFELVRPSISTPQRLRPLRTNTAPVRPPPPEPEPLSIPIRRPPIIPKPVHNSEKSPTSPISPNAIRFLPPNAAPVQSSLSSPSLSGPGFRSDNTNPPPTLSSVCADSFVSCSSGASRTSTTSSDEIEIHISEAFQDIEPPYIEEDLTTSSPVPSSWQAESPSNTPTGWIQHPTTYNVDSALPVSPILRKFSLPAESILRVSNPLTSTTPDREEEKEKWIPTASFIRPFEYNEWEEWDGESCMYTVEGSLGGYGGGDEESRISHHIHPTRFGQAESRGAGTRVSTQLRESRRGTITSTKGSEQLGTFNFDALPALQPVVSPTVTPAAQRKPRYRTCDASPPPPSDEASLTEQGRQGGPLRTWLVDIPKALIRRTQGGCEAAKEVRKDVLSRSVAEASSRNDSAYRDVAEVEVGQQRFGEVYQDGGLDSPTISTAPRPLLHSHPTVSKAKEKGKLDVKRTKEGWRDRWKGVLSVPAFKSPVTKILSPVVARAQWEVVTRSGILAFVISSVILGVLVAVPVP